MMVDASSIITDELRSWIGRTAGPFPVPEEVSASDVRRYLGATGDSNPLWRDDDVARAAGYRERIVPPMLVIELYRRVSGATGAGDANLWEGLPLPENYTDTRNAGAETEWLQPVYMGDRLTVWHRITDIVARQGRAGLGIYLIRESEFRRDGEVVVRLHATTVKLPARRGHGSENATS